MLTLELVNKKRSPAKLYAIIGALAGLACLILTGLLHHVLSEPVKKVLMVVVAGDFVICLFVLNYSYKFKNVIGHISFSNDFIEIELLQKKEFINFDNIRNIKFKLLGYEGLNNSSLAETFVFSPGFFSYYSGMNNFVYVQIKNETRTFEFYIANKKEWENLQRIVKYYSDVFASKYQQNI
jgi:hypothetical protein